MASMLLASIPEIRVYLPPLLLLWGVSWMVDRKPLGHQAGKLLLVVWWAVVWAMTVDLPGILRQLIQGTLAVEGPVVWIPGSDLLKIVTTGNRSDILTNLLGNVLAFVPLGLLLPLLWPFFRSWHRTVLAGMLFSAGIELMQLFTFRVTSVDDVLLNGLGALAGYWLAFPWLWQRRLAEGRAP